MATKTADWRLGPTVCRCCLAEGCYKDISTEYFWMGKREVYAEMLSDTFDVSIAYSQSTGPNSNSRLICEPCISRLRDASDFKRQVLECEKTFMQHLDPGRDPVPDVEVPLDPPEKEEVKLERVKLEEKVSDDDFDPGDFGNDPDDDDDDLDDQPLTKLASKIPKKESVDLQDLLDTARPRPDKRKAATKAKASPSKKAKKKETPKATASKVVAKPIEKKKKDKNELLDPVKQNAMTILNNSTACPFQQSHTAIRCYFCSKCFKDPCLFKTHMTTGHKHTDMSASVKRSDHALTRVEVTDLRCKVCNKTFLNLEDLAQHLNEEHDLKIDTNQCLGLVPFKLEKDRFVCVVCGKELLGLYQLYRHTSSHYSTHICEICGKNFETLGGFKIHVEKHDLKTKYSCQRCKKTFASAAERKDHFMKNNSCLPLRCKLCKERFTHIEKRNAHLTEVHGKPPKVHKCTKCEKVFSHRTLLLGHFKQAHTEANKCEYCGKTFPFPLAMKEHIYKVHTKERPYKCSVCDATFSSSVIAKRHTDLHDDSKKLHCPFCSRMFTRKDRFKQHMQRSHPEQNAENYIL